MEGQDEAIQAVESSGFFNEWFFNMFAATLEVQVQSPTFALLFVGLLMGLVILRIYFEDPIQTLSATGLYIYSVIQSYSLFSESTFVLETAVEGWQVTGEANPNSMKWRIVSALERIKIQSGR